MNEHRLNTPMWNEAWHSGVVLDRGL